jgi:hypothetical protein
VWIDQRSHRLLDGTTLDYDTTLLSRGFVFQNPHAKSTCGCGTSFPLGAAHGASRTGAERHGFLCLLLLKRSNNSPTREYKYGFETEVEADTFAPGSRGRRPPVVGEQGRSSVAARVPAQGVSRLAEHERADLAQPEDHPTDYQALSYYSAPKKKPTLASMDEVDPEVRKTFDKLGIP